VSDSSKAVFLSYASQDAEAARRIGDALRTAGVEVWFDQSELVGGDAWDTKIRTQIATCALFVPVISANTQARLEGYFRLEWKLAAQRTHTMADEKTFLLPVVIDDTRDADAKVPVEFKAVQWTRLRQAYGGQAPDDATEKFCERVQRLLESGTGILPVISGHGQDARATQTAPSRRAESGESPRKVASTKSRKWRAVIGAAFVVVGLSLWQPWKKSPYPTSNSKLQTQNSKPMDLSPAGLAKGDKSIAVLPFKNQSQEKDSAFFTDGVHEDILTNLFNIRELRVVSRTSVEQYRGTTKTMKQIGAELGVAYILEGSVQRVGDKVRVTGQLIDARADGHLWAKAFDEKLSDVFVIQASIAKAIAAELKAVLSPEERKLVERRATANPAAYDLYLKAREIGRTRVDGLEERQTLLQDALRLDPNFARAWSELALVRSRLARRLDGSSPDDVEKVFQARTAVDAAVRLAPDAPETLLCLGDFYYRVQRDYVRALEYLERMARLQPNDPEAFGFIGFVQRRQGRWVESTANLRKAVQLDPTNFSIVVNLHFSLQSGRRYDELIALIERSNSKVPSQLDFSAQGTALGKQAEIAYVRFLATGSTREMEEALASVAPEQLESPDGIDARKRWARLSGNFAEAIRLDRLQPYHGPTQRSQQAATAALTLAAHGNRDGARARLENFPAELRNRLDSAPGNAAFCAHLARMEIVLGNNEEALRWARKAVELTPPSIDAATAPNYRRVLASVHAWSGDKDRALTELAHVLQTPAFNLQAGATSVHVTAREPDFFPLRGDPRFEALLNDPKNNAPLF
jgi:TolB-like protein/cytochrome c-type biogenesis protein CcmH/NrfG